jgi:excisionase family DNA binding protein
MPAQKKKYRNSPIEFAAPKEIAAVAAITVTPQFLDVKQVALYLSATVASTRLWLKNNNLPCVKIGRRFTYNRDDINAAWRKQAA